MDKTQVLDKAIKLANKVNNNLTYTLEKQKQKLANKVFDNNEYVQEFIKNFDNEYEYSYFDAVDGFLVRGNVFDYTQVPSNLKSELGEYLQDRECLYLDNFCNEELFTRSCPDYIAITYDDEVYSSVTCKNVPFVNELHKFLLIEDIQDETGFYGDVVETNYYGDYYGDYVIPSEYTFLKLGMSDNEKNKRHTIDRLLTILKYAYNEDCLSIGDDNIIDSLIPDWVNKLTETLNLDIYIIDLRDNFDLHINVEIPKALRKEGLEQLNVNYRFTSYGTTILHFTRNIREDIETMIKED